MEVEKNVQVPNLEPPVESGEKPPMTEVTMTADKNPGPTPDKPEAMSTDSEDASNPESNKTEETDKAEKTAKTETERSEEERPASANSMGSSASDASDSSMTRSALDGKYWAVEEGKRRTKRSETPSPRTSLSPQPSPPKRRLIGAPPTLGNTKPSPKLTPKVSLSLRKKVKIPRAVMRTQKPTSHTQVTKSLESELEDAPPAPKQAKLNSALKTPKPDPITTVMTIKTTQPMTTAKSDTSQPITDTKPAVLAPSPVQSTLNRIRLEKQPAGVKPSFSIKPSSAVMPPPKGTAPHPPVQTTQLIRAGKAGVLRLPPSQKRPLPGNKSRLGLTFQNTAANVLKKKAIATQRCSAGSVGAKLLASRREPVPLSPPSDGSDEELSRIATGSPDLNDDLWDSRDPPDSREGARPGNRIVAEDPPKLGTPSASNLVASTPPLLSPAATPFRRQPELSQPVRQPGPPRPSSALVAKTKNYAANPPSPKPTGTPPTSAGSKASSSSLGTSSSGLKSGAKPVTTSTSKAVVVKPALPNKSNNNVASRSTNSVKPYQARPLPDESVQSDAAVKLVSDMVKTAFLHLALQDENASASNLLLSSAHVHKLKQRLGAIVGSELQTYEAKIQQQKKTINIMMGQLQRAKADNQELLDQLAAVSMDQMAPLLPKLQSVKTEPETPKEAPEPSNLVAKYSGSYSYGQTPTSRRQAPRDPKKGFIAPTGRSAGHFGLNLKHKPKPKLAAGPSRRPMEEVNPEQVELHYKCQCYAPKPFIYEQLGIDRDVTKLHKNYAESLDMTTDDIRIVQVQRTSKVITPKIAPSVQFNDIKGYISKGQEKVLLLVCHNFDHKCDARYQVCLVVVWDFWGSQEEATKVRDTLIEISDNLEPLKRKRVETDTDMIHEDGELGATYFAGCGWNRFQKNGGCKWSKSEKPRRFEPYDDPDVVGAHSTYSQMVYMLADRAADAMRIYVPKAFANMERVNGYACRIGEKHRIFSSGSINSDACLKPHRDSRDTKDGCGALLSWQEPHGPKQLHYIFNLSFLNDPRRGQDEQNVDNTFVAIDLGYGSLAFEVAGIETHATTPPEAASRKQPARLSYVLFQHKGLDRPDHGRRKHDPAYQSTPPTPNTTPNTPLTPTITEPCSLS